MKKIQLGSLVKHKLGSTIGIIIEEDSTPMGFFDCTVYYFTDKKEFLLLANSKYHYYSNILRSHKRELVLLSE